MREIKFRAWDKIAEEFIADTGGVELRNFINLGSLVPVRGGVYREARNVVFEQYTGLKDKNGKGIYEGDIIKYDDGEDMSYWVSGEKALIFSYGYKMVARMNPFSEYTGNNQNIMNEDFCDCVEVISNIHEAKNG